MQNFFSFLATQTGSKMLTFFSRNQNYGNHFNCVIIFVSLVFRVNYRASRYESRISEGVFRKQTSERLNRAGVIRIDLKAGFPQLFIINQTLCQAFESPLPEFNEVECQNCARHRSRLTELQNRIDELKRGQANARPEAQGLDA